MSNSEIQFNQTDESDKNHINIGPLSRRVELNMTWRCIEHVQHEFNCVMSHICVNYQCNMDMPVFSKSRCMHQSFDPNLCHFFCCSWKNWLVQLYSCFPHTNAEL